MHFKCKKKYRLQGEALYGTWKSSMSKEAQQPRDESAKEMQQKVQNRLAELVAMHQDDVCGDDDPADKIEMIKQRASIHIIIG